MNQVLRWSPIPAALLALAIAGCGDSKSSDGLPVIEKSSRSGMAAPEQPSSPATEQASRTRSIVLQVAGMMKSKSGAT